ncbi:MAG: sialate O-acetylesterase [Ruminococcus sp.]|nr:sialate O-acetylesterase [Ruminococcus sp.]
MFKCAQVFSDNMVLQRGRPVAVFGQGEDGVVVTAEIGDNRAVCTVKDGRWLCRLKPMAAAEGLELKVTHGAESVVFRDVAVGEVWFLGGQSNMELELQNAKDGAKYLSELNEGVPVRYYYTPKVATFEEAEREGARSCWGKAGSESSKAWSAVGFHFGMKLAKELGVVVGLIGCNWGGTSASCWVDRATLEADKRISSYIEEYDAKIAGKSLEEQKAEYEQYFEENEEWNRKSAEILKEEPGLDWGELEKRLGKNKWPGPLNEYNPFRPTNMFENMVMRVCPYTIKGFLYYQGESDDHKPDSYYRLFTALIDRWRTAWGDDTLPFIMVQLPMFKYAADPDYKHWCKIRSAQMKAYRTVKNTGIAVILDCGEFNEIHPKDKLPVGERLCLQAEKVAYGMDVDGDAPMFAGAVFEDGRAVVTVSLKNGGLVVKGEIPENAFELAGEDGEYRPAKAEIEGSTIVVTSAEVAQPKAVRYCRVNYGEVAVFGKNGIPLAPFSTSEDV